jgi:hypothetical protein
MKNRDDKIMFENYANFMGTQEIAEQEAPIEDPAAPPVDGEAPMEEPEPVMLELSPEEVDLLRGLLAKLPPEEVEGEEGIPGEEPAPEQVPPAM